jgi:hypothetical protein
VLTSLAKPNIFAVMSILLARLPEPLAERLAREAHHRGVKRAIRGRKRIFLTF